MIHKPHPGNIIKAYAMKQVYDELKMNKKITIYDLLGLIKNGKAPKKIKWENRIYNLESDRRYYCGETQ